MRYSHMSSESPSSRFDNNKLVQAFCKQDGSGRMVDCTVVVLDHRTGHFQSPIHFFVNFSNNYPEIFFNSQPVDDIQISNHVCA
uniref:Uncharacterized protein n=1 Tax=Acrobeloides nanus TaxID=290746 RepID=A0A914D667_9BILA